MTLKRIMLLILLSFSLLNAESQPIKKSNISVGSELSGFSKSYRFPNVPAGKEKLSFYYPRIGFQKGKLYLSVIGHYGTYKSSYQNLRQEVKGFGGAFRYYFTRWDYSDSAKFFWKIKNLKFIPVFSEINFLKCNYDKTDTAFILSDKFNSYMTTIKIGFHLRLYKFLYLTTGISGIISENFSGRLNKIGGLLGFEIFLK